MKRLSSTCLIILAIVAAVAPAARGQTFDPTTDNLFRDSPLKIVPAGPKDTDQSPKVNMFRPDFWKVDIDSGKTKLQGQSLPFDKEVKLSGDCSVRLEGTTGTSSFQRWGFTDTARFMYHGWSYRAGAKVKLKDVKGKVYAQAAYSNDKKKGAKELTGTTDWTELSVDFTMDRGTNTLNYFGIYLEGSGTVWIDDLQLKMVRPDAFKWWQSWNSFKPTTALSEPYGMDEKAAILKERPPHPQFDKYGGIMEVKGSKGATGFFYCEKIDGKWWLITPEGHGFYKVAMFSPNYRSLNDSGEALKQLGNGSIGWAEQAFKRLDSWGFNSAEWGAQTISDMFASPRCPKDLQGKGMSYTYILMLQKAMMPDCNGNITVPAVDWGWAKFPDVFSDEYAQAVKNYCTPGQKGSWFTDKKKDDPWLIGYILADEPPWYGPGIWYGSLTDGFHNLPDNSAGKKAWMEFVRKKYNGKIENLNKAWGASFASWEAFSAEKVLPRGANAVEDRRGFMFLIADKWYEVAVKYVKEIDHNHMILGGNATRLYPAVYAAEAKNVEVLTASLYNMPPVYHMYPDQRYFLNEQVEKWTGKPIMVGMNQGFLDAGRFPGTNSVANARYRGESWATYLREVASNPETVGLFWWEYTSRDEPNNEGYQKNWGIIDTSNRVYTDALPYVQLANFNVYNYRMGKTPAKLDPPLPSDPSHGMIELDSNVQFRILRMPYPVDTYEAELTDPAGKTQTFTADKKLRVGDFDYVAAEKKLAPGAYKWRTRIKAGDKVSDWSLPREFQVADSALVAQFKDAAKFVSDGKNWKPTASTGADEGKVTFQSNIKDGDKTLPLAFAVETGKVAKSIKFTCKLDKPVPAKAGYLYSLRVVMQGDTEAGANPNVGIGLKYGYHLIKDYDPIDRGWTVQHETSGDKPTYVRTTIRLPRDQQIEDLSINLVNCSGGLKILSIQLIPETEYEVGTQLMDYYKPLVDEYDATVGKK